MSKGLTPIGDAPLLKDINAALAISAPEPGAEAIAVIKRMQKTAQADPKEKDAPTSAELPDPHGEMCQLDLWLEPERGSPNAFLRSALFAAIQSEYREEIQAIATNSCFHAYMQTRKQ